MLDSGETKTRRAVTRNRALGGAILICILFISAPLAQQPGSRFLQNDSVLQKATQLLQSGKPGEAESILREYLATSPQDLKAKVLLGFAFDQQNRMTEAESI